MSERPEEQHSVKAGTEYVVLVRGLERDTVTRASTTEMDEVEVWRKVGTFNATRAEHAVRQYAEKSGSTTALTLAAVPSRYWYTETLAPKTVTTWGTA